MHLRIISWRMWVCLRVLFLYYLWMRFRCVTNLIFHVFICILLHFFFWYILAKSIYLSVTIFLCMVSGLHISLRFQQKKFLFEVRKTRRKNTQFKFCLQLRSTIAICWWFFCLFRSWTDHLLAILQLRQFILRFFVYLMEYIVWWRFLPWKYTI